MQAQDARNTVPEAEIAMTYQAVDTQHTVTTDGFWLQGGSVEIAGRVYRGLSAVANIYGGRATNKSTNGNGFNLVTYTFGPRYTWGLGHSRASIFTEALLGESQGFDGSFSGNSGLPAGFGNGIQSAATALAFQAGGGVDLRLTHRFAIRAIEAEYLRTQLPNAADNVQQNLRIGAGVVLRLGR
jgi:peptidoglycan-associated lipoprotein